VLMTLGRAEREATTWCRPSTQACFHAHVGFQRSQLHAQVFYAQMPTPAHATPSRSHTRKLTPHIAINRRSDERAPWLS